MISDKMSKTVTNHVSPSVLVPLTVEPKHFTRHKSASPIRKQKDVY
jgi:hypothetical protein